MGVGVIGATLSAPSEYEDLITSSTTWVKPAGVKTAEITVAGGGGNSSSSAGGAGFYKGVVNLENVTSLPITIGASGNVGGTTVVGGIVACTGGSHPFGSDRIGALGSVVFSSQRQSMANNGVGVVGEYRNVLNNGQSYRWRYKVAGYDLILMRDEGSSTWVASKDDGDTWTQLSTASANALNAACFDSLGTNTEIAAYLEGSPAGYIYSFDRAAVNANVTNVATSVDGITWTTRGIGGQNIQSVTMTPTRTVVAHTGGIFASTDNGANWTALTTAYTNTTAMLYMRGRDALVLFRGGDSSVYISYGSSNFTAWSSASITSFASMSNWNNSAYFKIQNQNINGNALVIPTGNDIWFHWKTSTGAGFSWYAYLTVPASGGNWSGWGSSTYGNTTNTSGSVFISVAPMTGTTSTSFNRRGLIVQQFNPSSTPNFFNFAAQYEAEGLNSLGVGNYDGNFTSTTNVPGLLVNADPVVPGHRVFFRKNNILTVLGYAATASQNSLPIGTFWGGRTGTTGQNEPGSGPGATQQGGATSTNFRAGGSGSDEGWCMGGSSGQQSAQWQYGSPGINGAVKIRYWR